MRDSAKKPLSRKQTTDQETFDYTTPDLKVQAKLPDMYAPPPSPIHHGVDPDVAAFSFAMHGIQEGLRGGARAKRDYDDSMKKKGAADAAAKKEAESTNNGYIYGYELVKGKAAAGEFSALMQQHFEENRDAEPQEFLATQAQTVRKFLSGRSEAFVEGLMPDVMHLEQQYQGAYVDHSRKKIQSDVLANASTGFMHDVKGVMSDQTKTPEEKAKAVRELASGVQAFNLNYRIDRNATTDHLLTIMGQEAIDTGTPELLDWVDVPDSANIKVSQRPEFAEKAHRLRQRAIESRDRKAQEREVQSERAERGRMEQLSIQIYDALKSNDPAQINEAGRLLDQMGDPDNPTGIKMNLQRYEHLRELFEEARVGGLVHPKRSNPDFYVEWQSKSIRGDLTKADIQKGKHLLTESDFQAGINRNFHKLGNPEKSPGKSRYDQLGKDLESLVSRKNAFGIDLTQNSSKRRYQASIMLETEYEAFVHANKREPNLAEIQKIHQTIKDYVFDKFPDDGSTPEDDSTSTTSGSKQSTAPAKSGPKPSMIDRLRSVEE